MAKELFSFLSLFPKKSSLFIQFCLTIFSISQIKQKGFALLRMVFLAVGLVFNEMKFLTQLISCEDIALGNMEGWAFGIFTLMELRVGAILEDFQEYAQKKRARIAKRSIRKFGKIAKGYLKMGWEAIAVCLTYRDLEAWEKGKRALSKYLNALRMYITRRYRVRFLYCWVREMQARGVPHYHVLLIVPKGVRIPKPDQSWWSWGMSNVKLLRFRGRKRIEYYLMDYLEKEIEEVNGVEYLKHSHVFGVSQLVKTDAWWSYVDFHRYLKKLCYIRFGERPQLHIAYICGKLRVIAIKFMDRYFQTYSEMKQYILDLVYNRGKEESEDYYLKLADSLGWCIAE